MYEMVRHVVIIDTQISLLPVEPLFYNGREYWGDTFREYADNTPPESIEKANWSSADNPTSFWFTRPSLINLLSDAGFSSVYECFTPTHFIPEGQNFKSSGIEAHNRCTFVAIKDDICQLTTSPSANDLHQNWPEHSLSYAANDKAPE